MPEDIPASLPSRGEPRGLPTRGARNLMAPWWAQIAEPFRETDFEQQDPWFDPTQFDPARIEPPRQGA